LWNAGLARRLVEIVIEVTDPVGGIGSVNGYLCD
jgi:hypothetical protein